MPVFPGGRTLFFCVEGKPLLYPRAMYALQTVLRFTFWTYCCEQNRTFSSRLLRSGIILTRCSSRLHLCLPITSLAFFPHLAPSAAVTHSLCKQACSHTNAFDNSSPSVAGYSGATTHYETQEHLASPPELG